MTRFEVAVLALVFPLAGVSLSRAQEQPLTEKEKIEALIAHVKEMKDAKFVRNDKEYDAGSAAKFLHYKWDDLNLQVKTATDFIEKVASHSATTGKPYLIRFKNGKQIESGNYLREVLTKLEMSRAEKRNP